MDVPPPTPRISYALASYRADNVLPAAKDVPLTGKQRARQFCLGLALWLLLALSAWFLLAGTVYFLSSDETLMTIFVVMFYLLVPCCGIIAAVTQLARYKRQWLGIGLFIGLVIYLLFCCLYLSTIIMAWVLS